MALTPTHIFVLLDGTRVLVAVEQRGDFVAVDSHGRPWCTNVGVKSVYWGCPQMAVTRIQEVLMAPGVLDWDLWPIIDASGAEARYIQFGGNPRVGVPLVYGWALRFGQRLPTNEEKKILRGLGFRFSGGRWLKQDG